MKKLQTTLAGYKSYIVAVVAALVGVYQVVHVSHLNTASVTAFLAAGGLAALRAAVAKVENALKAKV